MRPMDITSPERKDSQTIDWKTIADVGYRLKAK